MQFPITLDNVQIKNYYYCFHVSMFIKVYFFYFYSVFSPVFSFFYFKKYNIFFMTLGRSCVTKKKSTLTCTMNAKFVGSNTKKGNRNKSSKILIYSLCIQENPYFLINPV